MIGSWLCLPECNCDPVSADPDGGGLLSEGITWPDPGRPPILVLSAADGREKAARCLEAGAVDLAGQPVFGPELGARMRNLLALHRAEHRLATLAFPFGRRPLVKLLAFSKTS